MRKLTPYSRWQIVLRYQPGVCSMLTLAREFKVSLPTISKAIREAGGNCARPGDPRQAEQVYRHGQLPPDKSWGLVTGEQREPS